MYKNKVAYVVQYGLGGWEMGIRDRIIGWQTYNIARDSGLGIAAASGQLALIGLLQFVPLFLLTPFSGWAADHFDRRNLARLTVIAQQRLLSVC